MSRTFIDSNKRNSNSYRNDNNQSGINQKKIDPVAQAKWMNSLDPTSGWGIGSDQSVQMFASEEEEQVQKKSNDEEIQKKSSSDVEPEKKGSSGTQTEMPDGVKSKMESSFGVDFSGVNIHQNSDQASNIGALAYAQGNDVHFAPGQFNPKDKKGQELLGHELAHVVQQRQGRVKSGKKQYKGISVNSDPALEKEADVMGAQVAQAKDNGSRDSLYQSGNIGNKPGDPPVISVGIACTFGTGGIKLNLNFTVDKKMGDFTASYGFGVTYHSDFYETKKKGFEMRNSLMLDYNTKKFGASLGTNFWNGFGEMKEFDQRTGMLNLRSGKFGFTYENDGVPFGYIGLGDNGDSYRTAAASIQMGDFSLNTNLLTGLRTVAAIEAEKNDIKGGGEMGIPLEGKGEFGETYTHGFVFERKTPYRYGGLTINYKGTSVGINSDRYIRHPFQNIVAHDWIKDQRQFEVLSGDIKAVLNGSNLGFSKFTTWGQ